MERQLYFRPEAGQFVSSIAKDLILSVLTCGIYGLFWLARQMRTLNYLLEEERFGFIRWALLTIITCGIYHIYFEYVMARAINEVQGRAGMPVSGNLPIISVALAIVGLHLITDAIQQEEINRICGK